jgi:hypothetical protein
MPSTDRFDPAAALDGARGDSWPPPGLLRISVYVTCGRCGAFRAHHGDAQTISAHARAVGFHKTRRFGWLCDGCFKKTQRFRNMDLTI